MNDSVPIISDLVNWLLVIIPVGSGAVAVRCLIGMNTSEEDTAMYKKRLKNVLLFCVIAESLVGVLGVVTSYYGG